MDFSIKEREKEVKHHYDNEDYNLVQKLSSELKKELNDLLKGVIFFGSASRGDAVKGSDVDVMLILNDIKFIFSDEVITSIRIIIENTSAKVSERFHITTMHLSKFWDYVRMGDPIVINILRDGVSVYDEGFFEPVQFLLETGQLRPSKEAVWAYYLRAPKTLKNAKKKMLSMIVDMYWAVIDSAHSILMHIDVIPPAPHHVADMLDKYFVETAILDKKYLRIIRNFYSLAKDIGHEKVLNTDGKKIDTLMLEADDFVKRMKFILTLDKDKLKAQTKRI